MVCCADDSRYSSLLTSKMLNLLILTVLISLQLAQGEARMLGLFRELLLTDEAEAPAAATDSQLPTEIEDFRLTCNFAGRYPFIVSIRTGLFSIGKGTTDDDDDDGTVHRDRTELQNHICGGILIRKNAVLTAAHCVDPRSTRNAVVLPQVNLAGYDLEEPIEILQTVRAVPHPGWTGNLKDGNDIVILKLEKKSCLTPIERIGNSTKLSNKNIYHFYGFGRSGVAGGFSNLLQYQPLKYIKPSTCFAEHEISPNQTVACFAGVNAISVCSGDDGSPLTKTPDALLAYDPEVVGIASYTTGDCTEKGAAVLTLVYAYKQWIEDTLDSEDFKTA